jgi:uncharacterized membrane protein YbhN (UPF0104 family)
MSFPEGRRTPQHTRATSFVVPALRVALAIAAFWALRRELSGVDLGTLLSQLRRYGWAHLALGLACMTGSFLILGVVELLALRQSVRSRVTVQVALITGFVANALSQSIGVALLTGAAVRTRAYARYGLDTIAVAQVTAFVTITATVGLLAAGAVALLSAPAAMTIGETAVTVRPLGMLLAALVVAYLAWSFSMRGDSVGYGRWRLSRPSPGMAVSQMLLSTIDWLLAGTVLFAFMPASPSPTFGLVLGAYMIAQVIAVASHVPAGAGVFDVVVVALLANALPSVDRSGIVAALLLFRVTYYLVPLCGAIVVAAVVELARAKRPLGRDATYLDIGASHAG